MDYNELKNRIISKVGQKCAIYVLEQLNKCEQQNRSADSVSEMIDKCEPTDQVPEGYTFEQVILSQVIYHRLKMMLMIK
jgi:hypothetical protein